jgi:hypothetical protein
MNCIAKVGELGLDIFRIEPPRPMRGRSGQAFLRRRGRLLSVSVRIRLSTVKVYRRAIVSPLGKLTAER